MELYKHQRDIIDADPLIAPIALGVGGGKTRVCLELAEGKTLVIVPKQQKLDKTWEENAKKFGIKKDIHVVSKEEFKKIWETLPKYDTVIIDECFVSGTKILTIDGYKNIEDIKIGDIVRNAIGYGTVYQTFENTSDEIYEIKTVDGKVFKCTGNHPFLTTKGWVNANELNNTSLLMLDNMIYLEYGNKYKEKRNMSEMRSINSKRFSSWRSIWTNKEVLFKYLQEYISQRIITQGEGETQRAYIKTIIRADEIKQSNEKSRMEKESNRYTKKNWAQTKNKRWEWSRNANTAKNIISSTWRWLVCRTFNCYKTSRKDNRKISNMLQNRYCKSNENDCNRDRWSFSRFFKSTRKRQEKNNSFRTVRVESISIQKRGSNEKFRRGTKVYNIAITGHPSYIVNDVVVHNCHYTLGVYPDTVKRSGEMVPKSSQLFEALYRFFQKHPPKRFYPTSATPISKPMNLYALAMLMGKNWNFYEFRDIYYSPIRMGFRTMWVPKKGDKIKERLARSFKKLGAITGRLQDWFDVPEQTEIEKYFELTTEQKKAITELRMTEPDKMSVMTKSRAIENGILYYDRPTVTGEKTISMKRDTKIFPSEKIDYILERALEFDKLLIFANYIGQIEYIEQSLKDEGYIVFTLTGQTKKREDVIATAQKLKKCIVIAQASVSSGYELPDFPCCIFASKSYKALDLEQSKGRILRAGHLKKNLYIHLIIRDGIDEKCHKTVMSGMDFQEKLYD